MIQHILIVLFAVVLASIGGAFVVDGENKGDKAFTILGRWMIVLAVLVGLAA